MSCDFGIISVKERITNKEASDLYRNLCNGDISGVTPNADIEIFYSEPTKKHPEIDTIPESEIDNIDLCPWSITFDRSPGHIIISCVWSKANYVYELLVELAKKNNLALYTPQSEIIIYPDGTDGSPIKPWWKFW